MWKKKIKFDEKTYYLHELYYNKVDAKVAAEDIRNSGKYARLITKKGKKYGYTKKPKYGIYIRKRR